MKILERITAILLAVLLTAGFLTAVLTPMQPMLPFAQRMRMSHRTCSTAGLTA